MGILSCVLILASKSFIRAFECSLCAAGDKGKLVPQLPSWCFIFLCEHLLLSALAWIHRVLEVGDDPWRPAHPATCWQRGWLQSWPRLFRACPGEVWRSPQVEHRAACARLDGSAWEGFLSSTYWKISLARPVTVASRPFPLPIWEEHGCFFSHLLRTVEGCSYP